MNATARSGCTCRTVSGLDIVNMIISNCLKSLVCLAYIRDAFRQMSDDKHNCHCAIV